MTQEILSTYKAAFDELNILTQATYLQSAGDKKKVSDDFLSFLINAYLLGTQTVSKMLNTDLKPNVDRMDEVIYLMIDGKTFEDRVAEHMNADDLSGLQTLAESEYHRVFNAAEKDGADSYRNSTGLQVVKKWITMLDDKVRATHDYLEGAEVALDEEFFTYDGDHAPYPGGFEKAENNVNCRCFIDYTVGL